MLFDKIQDSITSFSSENVEKERKKMLQPLIIFIQKKVNEQLSIRLNFVCTHNSRRSHLSQIWAQTMAYQYNIKNVQCYSAGTEATALFPVIALTMKELGFNIEKLSDEPNPVYSIKYAENEPPIIGFSKTLDSKFNPANDFAAIMTCTQADLDCPFISGAEIRIPIPFEDPKAFDNTPQQAEKYKERSLQIASELSYVFSSIKINE